MLARITVRSLLYWVKPQLTIEAPLNGLLRFRLPLVALLLSVVSCMAMADPHTDYLLYCRGCHLANGEGVPPDVPTLVNELGKLVSVPGGREYIVRVPGVSLTDMNDKELAAVLNWVLSEFNAESLPDNFQPYTADEIGKSRQKVLIDPLRYRDSLLQKK